MNQSGRVLHVFNGDCAAEAWKKAADSAEDFIVWRENYLEGPLPPAETPRGEFARIRAEFLHTCVPEFSVEMLTRFQCGLEESLQSPGSGDTIMLWFDDCMFDMLLLARILFLLENTQAEIRLFCEFRVLGNESEIYRTPWRKYRKLMPETRRIFADAWRAVVSGKLESFLQSGRADTEDALKRALLRYQADHPQDGSPGLSEKKLLALVSEGKHEFKQIFRAFNASEERPFMGDTMCERLLQKLVMRGLLRRTEDSFYGADFKSLKKCQKSHV